MPNIKSAKKRVKQEAKRERMNAIYTDGINKVLNEAKKFSGRKGKKDVEAFVSQAYSTIDKAAKKKVIHDKKADRLKKRVTTLVSST